MLPKYNTSLSQFSMRYLKKRNTMPISLNAEVKSKNDFKSQVTQIYKRLFLTSLRCHFTTSLYMFHH